MRTIPGTNRPTAAAGLPPLHNGDRMTQAEFHGRYQAYPEDMKFELVGGIVYMASPLKWPHGTYHTKLALALTLYEAATPGAECGDNTTTILGEESEPQPDLTLRLAAEAGGQSQINEEQYVQGPPELLAEVSLSTRSLDMNQKREDYRLAGVVEYLVVCIEEQELHWFHFPSQSELRPRQGIYRSRIFPGLWIDGAALLARDSNRLIAAVQQGLATAEHARFVKRLQARRAKK